MFTDQFSTFISVFQDNNKTTLLLGPVFSRTIDGLIIKVLQYPQYTIPPEYTAVRYPQVLQVYTTVPATNHQFFYPISNYCILYEAHFMAPFGMTTACIVFVLVHLSAW